MPHIGGQLRRLLLCLLALFLLIPGTGPRTVPARHGMNDYPGNALRYLSDGNRIERQRLSPYDPIVKRNAERTGLDWRLLSAVIRQESLFRADAVSSRSAKGLMQLRDVAAVHFGYDPEETDLLDPDTNVRLGARLLADFLAQFRSEGMDEENALRFALAAYNCGSGTMKKRREETAAEGGNPNSWADVAAVFSRYAPTTPAYVDSVESTFARYRRTAD